MKTFIKVFSGIIGFAIIGILCFLWVVIPCFFLNCNRDDEFPLLAAFWLLFQVASLCGIIVSVTPEVKNDE